MAYISELINFKNRLIFVSVVLLLAGICGGAHASVPRSEYPWNNAGRSLPIVPVPPAAESAVPAAGDASGIEAGQAGSAPLGEEETGSHGEGCGVGNPEATYCIHPAFRKPRAQ